jgi:hypothetical protein
METEITASTPKTYPVITGVEIERKLSHNDKVASPGHAWFVFSFLKDGVKHDGAIQITTAWEEVNNVYAYIKKTYIFQRGSVEGSKSEVGNRKSEVSKKKGK